MRKGRPGHPYKTPSLPRPRMMTEEGLAADIIHRLGFVLRCSGGGEERSEERRVGKECLL